MNSEERDRAIRAAKFLGKILGILGIATAMALTAWIWLDTTLIAHGVALDTVQVIGVIEAILTAILFQIIGHFYVKDLDLEPAENPRP